MKKKYILNGKIYYEEDLTPFAKENNMSFQDYINEVGAKEHIDNSIYEFNGKEYTGDVMADFAKENDMPYEDYIIEIGAKKKEQTQPKDIFFPQYAGSQGGGLESTTSITPDQNIPTKSTLQDGGLVPTTGISAELQQEPPVKEISTNIPAIEKQKIGKVIIGKPETIRIGEYGESNDEINLVSQSEELNKKLSEARGKELMLEAKNIQNDLDKVNKKLKELGVDDYGKEKIKKELSDFPFESKRILSDSRFSGATLTSALSTIKKENPVTYEGVLAQYKISDLIDKKEGKQAGNDWLYTFNSLPQKTNLSELENWSDELKKKAKSYLGYEYGGIPTDQNKKAVDLIDNYSKNLVYSTFSKDEINNYLQDKLNNKEVEPSSTSAISVIIGQPSIFTKGNNLDNYSLESISDNLNLENPIEKAAFDIYARGRSVNDALGKQEIYTGQAQAPKVIYNDGKPWTNSDFEAAAIKYVSSQSPEIKAQINALGGFDMIPNSMKGSLVKSFLDNPDVIKEVQANPELKSVYNNVKNGLYISNPDFAKKDVSQIISQGMEDLGETNWLVNIPTQSQVDNVVEKLRNSGKLTDQQIAIYKDKIRGDIGVLQSAWRGIARVPFGAFVEKSPIQTGGLIENTQDAFNDTMKGYAKSISDIAAEGTLPAIIGELIGAKESPNLNRLYNVLDDDYKNLNLNYGLTHTISAGTGNIIGFTIPLIAGTALLKNVPAGHAINNILAFEGHNRDKSLMLFPDNTQKQALYTLVSTAGDAVLADLLPTKAISKNFQKIFKNESANIVNELLDKKITENIAKQRFKNLTNKAVEFLGKNAKTTGVMTAFGLYHDIIDKISGAERFKNTDYGELVFDKLKEAKTTFLTTPVLAVLEMRGVGTGSKKANYKVLWEISKNPTKYEKLISENTEATPEQKQEMLNNLNIVNSISKDLADPSLNNLTERQKQKYLANATVIKIYEEKAKQTTDDVLKKSYLDKIKERKDILNNILKNTDKADELNNYDVAEDEKLETVVTETKPGEQIYRVDYTDPNTGEKTYKLFKTKEEGDKFLEGISGEAEGSYEKYDGKGEISTLETEPTPSGIKKEEEVVTIPKGVEKAEEVKIPERPKEKGEPEVISKPIELSLEPVKVGEEVTPKAEGEVPKAAEPIEAFKDVESTAKALEVSLKEGGKIDEDGFQYRNEKKVFPIVDTFTQKMYEDYQRIVFEEEQKSPEQFVSEAYHKAKADGSNPELVTAVEGLLGKPTEAAPTPQAGSVVGGSLRDVELKMRRPEKNEVIFVSVDALLQKHAADQPSYDIQKSENRIKGRVEKAKEFIKNYIKDQRAINPKTGERMNTKVSFEPSVVDIDANGKISFEDGRHRVLAAKEMGLTEVPIEVPKESVKAIEQFLKETPKAEAAPTPTIEGKIAEPTVKPEPTTEAAKPTPEVKPEPTVEKTELQKATEARKAAKAKLDAIRRSFGISNRPELEALVDYHRALVAEAKEFIKEKLGDINDFAKSLGEKVNVAIQKAWDEANGGKKVEKYEDLGYKLEDLEPVQPTTESGKKEIIENENVYVEPRSTIFSHRGLQEVATEFGLADVSPRERKSDLMLFKEVDNIISEWVEKGVYDKNIKLLIEKAKQKLPFSEQENLIMAQHIAQLREQGERIRNKYGIDSSEYNEKLKEINEAIRLSESVRSQQGAALRVPIFARRYSSTLEDAMTTKMEALGVDELLPSQKEEVKKLYDKIDKAKKEFEEYKKQAEEKFKELQAQIELNKISKEKAAAKGKKEKRNYAEERKAYLEELKNAVAEYKNVGQKLGIKGDASSESFIISAKMAKIIMKIVGSHVSETGAKLSEVVEKTYNDVKDAFSGITEKDIRDIISGKYAEKRETETEIVSQLRQLKYEQILLNEYENLLKGGQPSDTKKAIKRNQRLAELRQMVDALRKEKGYKKYSEEELARRIIEANKKRVEELIRKKNNKEFEKNPIPKTFWESNDFKQRNPDLYKKILNSYAEKENAQLEFDVAILKDQESKKSKLQKGLDWLGAGANTTKKIVTGIDDSALFMQTLAAIAARPKIGAKAIKEHILDAIFKKRYERKLAEIHNSPDWELMKKSGLNVTEPKSLLQEKREEAFSGKTWDIKFNANGKEYKILEGLLSPFERAFTSLGNNMRVMAFRNIAEKLMKEGYTFEKNPKVFEDLASLLNTETGRGKQNEYIEKASNLVTKGIWSPRLMASRLNMLGISDAVSLIPGLGTKGYYRQLEPRIRKEAVKDLIKFTSTVMATSYLIAYVFGGKVDDDTTSPTFLDIKMPNGKSYNISAGFAQYIRLLAQTIKGGKTTDGVFKKFEGQKDRGANVMRFMRGKLTPLAGATIDLMTGKDFMGNPITLLGEVKKLTIPLSLQNLAQDINKDGLSSLYNSTLPSFVGINVKDEKDYAKKGIQVKSIGLDLLKNNNVEPPEFPKVEKMKVNVDAKHPQGLMKDEEQKEFLDLWQKEVVSNLDDVAKGIEKKNKEAKEMGGDLIELSEDDLKYARAVSSRNASEVAHLKMEKAGKYKRTMTKKKSSIKIEAILDAIIQKRTPEELVKEQQKENEEQQPQEEPVEIPIIPQSEEENNQ